MDELEREQDRQRAVAQNRAAASKSVSVNSVNDIIRLIQQLDPSNPQNRPESVDIVADVDTTEDSKTVSKPVRAVTNTISYRQLLLDALNKVQTRLNTENRAGAGLVVNGRAMLPPPVVGSDGQLQVDSLIRRLLGASRRGTEITWRLSDGMTYVYDIFAHKLYRECREQNAASDASGV